MKEVDDMNIQEPKIKNQLETNNTQPFEAKQVEGITIETNPKLIDTCIFKNVTFINVNFTETEIIDTIFDSCIFIGAKFQNATLVRTIFKNSKLSGSIFDEGSFRDIQVIESVFNLVSIDATTLTNCLFENSNLNDNNYYNVILSKVYYENNELFDFEIYKTKMKEIDLSRNKSNCLKGELADFKGATLNSTQANSLIERLGIKVSDMV